MDYDLVGLWLSIEADRYRIEVTEMANHSDAMSNYWATALGTISRMRGADDVVDIVTEAADRACVTVADGVDGAVVLVDPTTMTGSGRAGLDRIAIASSGHRTSSSELNRWCVRTMSNSRSPVVVRCVDASDEISCTDGDGEHTGTVGESLMPGTQPLVMARITSDDIEMGLLVLHCAGGSEGVVDEGALDVILAVLAAALRAYSETLTAPHLDELDAAVHWRWRIVEAAEFTARAYGVSTGQGHDILRHRALLDGTTLATAADAVLAEH